MGGDLTLLNMVHLRGGYELLTQNQSESEYGATYGAGIEYSVSKFVINVDYAYRSFKSFKGNQVLGIRVSF
jgi:opacity protein-like surface antigen